MSRNTPKCMEDRMRKARLLQSVAIFAGSLALTLAPSDSRGQSAIDSGSQGYQTYGYGMQGSDAFDPEQLRGSEPRLYGAADQYGVAIPKNGERSTRFVALANFIKDERNIVFAR